MPGTNRSKDRCSCRELLAVQQLIWWQRGLALLVIVGAVYGSRYLCPTWGPSASLFNWLPAGLALALVFTGPARTGQGAMFKFITFALLLSAVSVGERYIFILMAAPFFHGIGALIAYLARLAARDRANQGPAPGSVP